MTYIVDIFLPIYIIKRLYPYSLRRPNTGQKKKIGVYIGGI